jgi:nicotinamide-nucleotide amidase
MTTAATDEDLHRLAEAVAAGLLQRRQKLAIAESCTGGLIGKLLTDLPGSSRWFDCGLITYSNSAKQALLGVPAEVLVQAGAVSAEAVMAMASGLLARTPVDWTLAVSGIAGPDGGTSEKPVGTVWIGWAGRGQAPSASRFQFPGDRASVRGAAAANALRGLVDHWTIDR